jgi:hypothetical protein
MGAIGRRGLLGRGLLGLAAAGLAAGGAGPALAFRQVPDGEADAMLGRACGGLREIHREIVAKVERELGVRLSEDQGREIASRMSCPHCGCPMLAALRDAEGGGAPPF